MHLAISTSFQKTSQCVIYCGSTEHDHLQCEDPNNADIKKVLKNMREALTEKGDVDMEQEEETTENKDDTPEEVPKEQNNKNNRERANITGMKPRSPCQMSET